MCKCELSIDKFATRKDRGHLLYQSNCKECQKNYRKLHYEKNKQKYIDKAALYTKNMGEWFRTIKSQLSCEECGESRWWVLDFHHKDPNEKDEEISTLIRKGNKNKILNEMKKCSVLCANCHRDLHYKQTQH